MNKEQRAIYEILREFAVRHLTSEGEFDAIESSVEIERVLLRIDQARGVGEEPDQLAPREAELVKGWVLENIAGHARAAKDALKKSAYADVVRAIIDCERFLVEVPDELDRGNRVITYLETMRELEARLAADLEPSRGVVEEKNNGNGI